MVRLLIVEDEKVTRETIKNLIDWPANGIKLIGACSNGIEAYDVIVDEYPDIVLTDIRMPGLDGLSLIKQVYYMDKEISFIVLSGYGEFEYAKTAMKYGVRDYLLKPCDESQILEAIRRLQKEILKRHEVACIQQENELQLNQFHTAIKKQFTIEALTTDGGFSLLMERYGKLLTFPLGKYYLYCISFAEDELSLKIIEQIPKLLKIHQIQLCFNILLVKKKLLMMLCIRDAVDLNQFNNEVENLALQVAGRPAWEETLYDTVQFMLEELLKSLKHYSHIILIDNDGNQHEIFNYINVFHQAENTIKALEKAEHEKEITNLLQTFFDTLDEIEPARMLATRLVVQTAANMQLLSYFNTTEFLSILYVCSTVKEINRIVENQLISLFKESERQKTKYKYYVNCAMEFVKSHLADPKLSLKWVTENHLYMNANYFSRQFVKETDEKFSSYLNRMRMEKAKELIIQYDLERIYMVAEQVGYGHNPQYFSQLFKKRTGLTPSQYKEQYKRMFFT
jgi:YesN/AraC family two-component response regulator